jgi:uncharacterized protein (DUF4415 family)
MGKAAKLVTRSAEPEYGTPDDENPLWTKEDFARARPLNEVLAEHGFPPIVGRPRSAVTKTPVNLRLDPAIVEHFKAGGPGWQTRINEVLGRHVKAARRRAS